jgi:membrane-bound serine protease (ClpP class)
VSIALLAGLLMLWLAGRLVRLRRRGAVSGIDSIVGGTGVAMESFSGDGYVWLEGESWQASSPVAVQKDQKVKVRAIHGLRLEVEPWDHNSS